MSLTAEQKNAYRRDGYLVVENIVDAPTLARLRMIIADFKERSKSVTRSDAIFDVGPGHSPETPNLRRLKDPVARHPEFDALMRSDAIVDIVADLNGSSVRFDHSKLNFKPAGGNAKIEWHQDWAFYPHTNDDLLAVGVMIEDCTPENGPLMVIPGSHKGEVYDHPEEVRLESLDRPDAERAVRREKERRQEREKRVVEELAADPPGRPERHESERHAKRL